MKKRDIKKIALLGLISGLCTASLSEAADSKSKFAASDTTENVDENEGYYLMSEEELLENLNASTKKIYEGLTPAGKELARKVASQRCNGTNECKGLNACKTGKNDCAGKGQCKGQSKCAFGDKNQAVKLAAKKMAEKRGEAVK